MLWIYFLSRMSTPSDQTELTFLRLLERTKKLCDNVETNAHKIQAAAGQLEALLNKMHELNKWVYIFKISSKFCIFSFLTIKGFYEALIRLLKTRTRGASSKIWQTWKVIVTSFSWKKKRFCRAESNELVQYTRELNQLRIISQVAMQVLCNNLSSWL